ncbi:MAG: ribosome recycling factor [Elusimicrobiota bacterium]
MDTIRNVSHMAEANMKKSIEKLKEELLQVRTGRANPGIFDNIKIESYGTQVPLNQIASILVPEPRVLEIKPWDVNTLRDIEKAISNSSLGLTPNNDGKLIRLILPKLTEETRKDLVKYIKKVEEQQKIAIRNQRREAIEELKNAEKGKVITEDLLNLGETEIQKLTDKYIHLVEDMIKHKEQEIMEV